MVRLSLILSWETGPIAKARLIAKTKTNIPQSFPPLRFLCFTTHFYSWKNIIQYSFLLAHQHYEKQGYITHTIITIDYCCKESVMRTAEGNVCIACNQLFVACSDDLNWYSVNPKSCNFEKLAFTIFWT